MAISCHQYSCYAPLKPDISHGMMGPPSQISMNHAVKELLFKNMLQMALRRAMASREQIVKVQGRTTW